ncbi:hypothetical protein SDC9_204722 [bioreactor metagenome]|uniref:Uncharacterized protein n=1 Tax=bioreactor metagenome TaxID=1076179 RepID=A0A645J027_9ZZZZ
MTIEEMNSKMTVFYLKSSGKIKTIATGVHDMNIYSDEKEDMSLIIDFIIVDKNDFIFNNITLYKVESGTIKLNAEIPM